MKIIVEVVKLDNRKNEEGNTMGKFWTVTHRNYFSGIFQESPLKTNLDFCRSYQTFPNVKARTYAGNAKRVM